MTDTYNGFAPILVAELMEVDAELLDADTRSARDLLSDWDYRQDADSAPAAYYNAVWRHLLAGIFHDELTGDLRPDGGDRWFEVLQVDPRSTSRRSGGTTSGPTTSSSCATR